MKNSYIGVVFVYGLLLLALTSCSSRGISIVINNSTANEVQDFLLEYTGGKKVIGSLLSNKSIRETIKPTGESSLIISFRLDEKVYREKLDVYIEPGYRGYITINIKEKGVIVFEPHIDL